MERSPEGIQRETLLAKSGKSPSKSSQNPERTPNNSLKELFMGVIHKNLWLKTWEKWSKPEKNTKTSANPQEKKTLINSWKNSWEVFCGKRRKNLKEGLRYKSKEMFRKKFKEEHYRTSLLKHKEQTSKFTLKIVWGIQWSYDLWADWTTKYFFIWVSFIFYSIFWNFKAILSIDSRDNWEKSRTNFV